MRENMQCTFCSRFAFLWGRSSSTTSLLPEDLRFLVRTGLILSMEKVTDESAEAAGWWSLDLLTLVIHAGGSKEEGEMGPPRVPKPLKGPAKEDEAGGNASEEKAFGCEAATV